MLIYIYVCLFIICFNCCIILNRKYSKETKIHLSAGTVWIVSFTPIVNIIAIISSFYVFTKKFIKKEEE